MADNSRGKTEKERNLKGEIAKQMVTLSTSGFGLVAALAWNNFIQDLFAKYINKWLPGNGSLISLFLYAAIVTILAVLITYNLSKISNKLSSDS